MGTGAPWWPLCNYINVYAIFGVLLRNYDHFYNDEHLRFIVSLSVPRNYFLIIDEKCPLVQGDHEWRVHNSVIQVLSPLMEPVPTP